MFEVHFSSAPKPDKLPESRPRQAPSSSPTGADDLVLLCSGVDSGLAARLFLAAAIVDLKLPQDAHGLKKVHVVLIGVPLRARAALSKNGMEDLIDDLDEFYDPIRNAVRKEKSQDEPD